MIAACVNVRREYYSHPGVFPLPVVSLAAHTIRALKQRVQTHMPGFSTMLHAAHGLLYYYLDFARLSVQDSGDNIYAYYSQGERLSFESSNAFALLFKALAIDTQHPLAYNKCMQN